MATINYGNFFNSAKLTITGSDDADLIRPSSGTQRGNDTIFGLNGDDNISGGLDNDTLLGGDGRDSMFGGDGNDTLFGGIGSDRMFGGSGNDTISVEVNYPDIGTAGFGIDVVSGGDGFDTVNFETAFVVRRPFDNPRFATEQAEHGVAVDLSTFVFPGLVSDFVLRPSDTGDFLPNMDTFVRGQITDSSGTTSILADVEQFNLTSHADFFFDSSAGHIINAGGGDDFIEGGKGFDVIDGGDGIDTAIYRSSTAGVSVVLLETTPGNGGSGSFGDAEGDRLFSIENVTGSAHNDFVLGDAKNNTLRGFAGEDTLIGGTGSDTLEGGTENDTLRGGLGNDRVDGGSGSDTAIFTDWNGIDAPFLATQRGTITLGDGANLGSATFTRSSFSAIKGGFITTTLETDTLVSIENVIASDFAETITGNASANKLEGRGGNDVLDGGNGSDILIGGDGIDTAKFSALGTEQVRVTASLVSGSATVSRTFTAGSGPVTINEFDSLSGIENLTGSTGNDSLVGNSGINTLDGGNGNDVLSGLGGADKLIGGEGSDTADYTASAAGVSVSLLTNTGSGGDAEGDTLSGIENLTGSAFADTLIGNAAANTILGGLGPDTIEGGAGGDTLLGGTGLGDTLSYEHAAGSVTVALDNSFTFTGDAAGDSISSFENLTGSASGGDVLRGNSLDNIVKGLGGDDFLQGGLGVDTLDGGEGRDAADYSQDGAVTIDMARGVFLGAAAGDSFISIESVFGGNGDNTIKGDDNANSLIALSGDNRMDGRGNDDFIQTGTGQDRLTGGEGDDRLLAGENIDTLIGNAGADTLNGEGGADTLEGGAGDDTLFGGLGRDTFVFTGTNTGEDTIQDWQDGVDLIEINSRQVGRFADLDIVGNGTDTVSVTFGDNTIVVHSASAFTLTNDDFSIL